MRVERLQVWLRQHLLVALLLAGLLGGAVSDLATRYGPLRVTGDLTSVTNRALGSDFPGGASVRIPLIVPKLTPSVVEIHARSLTGTSVGSGIVLSANGLILSNFHVVSPASPAGSLTVRLARGQQVRQATLVGADPAADLAVLQVRQTGGLTPAPLGNSSRTRIGEAVIAMGSPEGLQGSVSEGIVSALNRTIRVAGAKSGLAGNGPPVTYKAIQTDAAVNPGSSGGALVNMRGEVIGMTSSVYHPVAGGASTGLNFAIPINDAKALVTRMLTAHS
ncbi:S1C family serine protease [Actinopolymorpha cephalotaxi]|uniref:S1C family serine protease n=1 Tax=Actinopolymorpha cephalotaxi TaxID=504797 RepID=UPI001EDC5A7B|nr:trypsin-like peptidase domain-containing protein [Actinopolymorpha cephalotaxi]